MIALARLCCVVLMVVGLALFLGDAAAAEGHRTLAKLTVWPWGLGAMAAGVFGTALLSIAQAMVTRADAARTEQG